jgi:hypothetical protein
MPRAVCNRWTPPNGRSYHAIRRRDNWQVGRDIPTAPLLAANHQHSGRQRRVNAASKPPKPRKIE